jgi:diamine N-acetyltransferase
MNIHGKHIIVRAIEAEDLHALHTWFNDPDVARGLSDVHFPSSHWQLERWFERIQADDHTIRLSVQLGDGTLIGYTGFWAINWHDRRAEHALVIGDSANRGKGYGRDIIATCARYSFEEMGYTG